MENEVNLLTYDLRGPCLNEIFNARKILFSFSAEGIDVRRSLVVYVPRGSRDVGAINFFNPTGHVMPRQFNIQQLYVLPTLNLCVLYSSENRQRLVPLTA